MLRICPAIVMWRKVEMVLLEKDGDVEMLDVEGSRGKAERETKDETRR